MDQFIGGKGKGRKRTDFLILPIFQCVSSLKRGKEEQKEILRTKKQEVSNIRRNKRTKTVNNKMMKIQKESRKFDTNSQGGKELTENLSNSV